jgi:sulfonate transport system substrate-binding protein
VSAEASKTITLGGVVSPEQIKAQAKAFADLNVIQKDVSGDIVKYWDGSFVTNALKQ